MHTASDVYKLSSVYNFDCRRHTIIAIYLSHKLAIIYSKLVQVFRRIGNVLFCIPGRQVGATGQQQQQQWRGTMRQQPVDEITALSCDSRAAMIRWTARSSPPHSTTSSSLVRKTIASDRPQLMFIGGGLVVFEFRREGGVGGSEPSLFKLQFNSSRSANSAPYFRHHSDRSVATAHSQPR